MLRHCASFVFVVLFAWAAAAPQAQAIANALPEAQASAVDAAVEARMAQHGVVGVAIGIIREGQVVYLNGYGLADREASAPVTVDTVFNIASNSKPIAAVAAMQLVDAGLLDLDADIRDYVPEYPDPGAVVTMRQLLCHQSGLPHYTNGPVIPTEREYDVAVPFLDPLLALDRFNQSPLMFTPGEQFAYSTPGFILASAVVQAAGGIPYGQQLQERIMTPLGISSLTWDVETDGQPHWAAGYQKTPDGRVLRVREEAHYWKHGGGGHKMNIRDFARFAAALINRELVSEESEQMMWTPQVLSNGDGTNAGLGFIVDGDGDALRVSHNGSQVEAVSRMVLYPRARHGLVVVSNSHFASPQELTTAIYEALGTE